MVQGTGVGGGFGPGDRRPWCPFGRVEFNNGLPETRNESKELDAFAADVGERTGGSLTIDVFHGGSLNLENSDVVRWLPRGAVEMGLVWANYLGRDAPALNAVLVQGSVGSSDELIAVLPEIQKIYAEELARVGYRAHGLYGFAVAQSLYFLQRRPGPDARGPAFQKAAGLEQ